MATNKVIKVIRKATKKVIGNSSSDYADVTVSKSGSTITITATFGSAKTGKVAFYSKVPSIADNNNPPSDLSGWSFLGSSDISGTSTTFVHTLTEFSAISYCARMVLADNPATDNGTADFSS
jgi:hypothetical protein